MTLVELLQERSSQQPDKTLYVYLADDGSEASGLTYAELDERARAVAVHLTEATKPGERVLLLYPPGLEFIAAFFGCLYAGVVAVPAYPPGSHRTLPRLRSIIRDAQVALALTPSAHLTRFEALTQRMPELKGLRWLASDQVDRGMGAAWTPPPITADSLAFLQYTSGSTSDPKGVMITHGNVLQNEEMIRRAFGLSQESVVVGWLPFYHDMGLIGNVLQPLYTGARCVLMSPVRFLQRPRRWLEAISRYRGTVSGGPNFAYELCVRRIGPEDREGLDLSTWAVAFNGSEPVRAETMERFAEAFVPWGFRYEAFYPCYGLAEATLFVSGGEVSAPPVAKDLDASALEGNRVVAAAEDGGLTRRLVGCGRSWLGQEVAVVDPEAGTPCPSNSVGEIWIAGPSVAQGYWGRPEETERTFWAYLAPDRRGPFLRTGDLGFMDERGELFVTGRLKDLIILRGRNLYPQDIELAVERSHPGLRPGCGAAFSVEVGGEERLVVVQEVERRAESGPLAEILEAVRQAVSEEHQVQVYEVVLVTAGAIPKTSSGKIQRHACRQAYLAGDLKIVARSGGEVPEEVEGEPGGVEMGLQGLLVLQGEEGPGALVAYLRNRAAAILQQPAHRVKVDRPLTGLGLDSLSAVQLQHAVEEDLGVSLSLASLLEGASVNSVAAAVLSQLQHPTAGDLPPLVAGEEEGEFPLSYGQKSLWFLQQLAPASGAYQIAAALRVRGDLDLRALRRSFQALMARHPSLRTTFHPRGDEPVQRVHPAMELEFREEDVRSLEEQDFQERLRQEAFRPFDLEAGPLLRVSLFHREPEDPLLVFVVHHIVADFWSLAVAFRELEAFYRQESQGEGLELAPQLLHYGDYVCWQRECLEGPWGEEWWEYWRQALEGVPDGIDLPTDRPRPPVQTDRGDSLALALDGEITRRLRGLAHASEATLFMVLLGAFQVLLHRYSGQTEVVVGSPATNRSRAELSGLVGYFVNPLVLRGDFTAEPSFSRFLNRLRHTVLAAFRHQEYPFALLVERLQPLRDPSRAPLFQVMFVFQQSHRPEERALAPFALGEEGARIGLGPLVLESVPLRNRPVQFDLTLMVAEADEDLQASLQYNVDLYDRVTVQRMLGHFQALLRAAVTQPDLPVGHLSIYGPEERHQLLLEWNDTIVPYAKEGLIHELFEAQAERTPEGIALVAGDECLSYRELECRAHRLARHLRELGVGPEVPVGVHLHRSPEMVVGLLGILKAGGAYLPLDPAYPPARLAYMLEDARAPVVLTQENLKPWLSEQGVQVVCLDTDWPQVVQAGDEPLPSTVGPDHPAYIIYTSGSTGAPKGVVVRHSGVVNFLASMARQPGLSPKDVLVAVTSLSFDIAALELYLPLALGARLVLAPREVVEDGTRLLRLLEESMATVMQATPATWRLLLAGGWDGRPRIKVLCGGEALPQDLAEELLARGESVWNLYGPTETTIWSAVERVPPPGLEIPKGPTAAIGRPMANTRIYILDSHWQPGAMGVPGEILIGGDGLARGYLRRPGLTAERFVPDALSGGAGARLYRTGDQARYRPDGRVEFLGRLDHQVKVRGFRVELGEIEGLLVRHPAVQQAVVVAQGDPSGHRRLVAYVVPVDGTEPVAAELRRFLGDHLPGPLIPSLFVVLQSLPLTPNGKVDRRALPAPQWGGGVPVTDSGPSSELERALVRIWQEVLGVEKVGRSDNFFDLGGHSLLLAQVHQRIRESLGLSPSMVDLFRYPTVATLAAFLSSQGKGVQREKGPLRSPRARRQPAGQSEMAVIGMAGRFPRARTVEELWERLRNGEECISFFSQEELLAEGLSPSLLADLNYVKAGGVLEGADLFDAAFFGFTPREARLMDPQHRVFLECAWHALEDAGYDPEEYSGRIGLYAGVGIHTYLHHVAADLLDSTAGQYQAFIGNDKDFVPTRVSYKLNLRGPSVNVQTACSSSLVAVHLACQSLLAGECDMALAGGISIRVPLKAGYLYEEGGILSPDGHCRAFDARARGTVFGSGVGIVVLKPLAAALADGDHIRAVIRSSAINNDGALKMGYTAPSVEGQAEVIAEALGVAGVDPETVSYIEAHGTGTELGDPIEVAALTEVFGGSRGGRRSFCAIGSVKTNLGHLDTAAGIAGLIKTVLALHHRTLPPSLHFETPNPKIDFEQSPFYVNTRLTEWKGNGGPLRAGVSSFGIGGTNAHVVLEEAPAGEASSSSRPWQLLVLSARTPSALETATRLWVERLQGEPGLNLADVAYTQKVGRRAMSHRRMVVCQDTADGVAALKALDPERVWTVVHDGGERQMAFLFPGQGAQHVQMGRELYALEPTFRREIDACVQLLEPHLGLDLRQLLYPGEESPESLEEAQRQLEQTAFTQPALFVVEYALARLWMEWGVQPAAMLGHSVGEYVAACLAGVFSLPDALALVAARGRLMQTLPGGAMLSVELPPEEVKPLLGSELSLAAVNAPAAVVVAGSNEEIGKLEGALAERGVRHRRLHTSHAFHSAMMDPILPTFAAQVSKVALRPPQIPFLSNLTGTWIRAEEATDPGYWSRHLRGTVRFADGVRELLREPGRVLLEVGPGQGLSHLAQQIRRDQGGEQPIVPSLRHPRSNRSDEACLLEALGRLWLGGVKVDWRGFYRHETRRRVPLPLYPFEGERHWLERKRPASEVQDPAKRRNDLREWFYVPLWKQSVPPAPRQNALPDHWLLLRRGEGLGTRLAAALRARGRRVSVVVPGEEFSRLGEDLYAVAVDRRQDYDALLQWLCQEGGLPERVVHLWGVDPAEAAQPSPVDLEAARRWSFHSLVFLVQALERAGLDRPIHLGVVSNHLHRISGAEVLRPEKALALGLVKSIHQEHPNLTCQSLDVLLPEEGSSEEEELVEVLVAELAQPGDEPVVAYRGGTRWVRTFEGVPLEGEGAGEGLPGRLRQGGVYLLTGGLGGLGLVLAEELARKVQAKLVLVSRSSLPDRNRWPEWLERADHGDQAAAQLRRLLALEELGAEVLALRADVTDERTMAAAIRAAEERFGTIHGVIHAAGVPGGGILQLKTPERAERVLAPKVQGTLVLHALLRDRDLDFFVLCSSINALIGGFGQGDYAAANAFCDAFAQAHASRRGTLYLSINWDRWEGVGMGAQGVSLFAPFAPGPGWRPASDEAESHPLLGICVADTPDRTVYLGELSPRAHWVLAEHRVAGRPTVPGTAYLEMARAAFARRAQNQPIEIREAVFLTPLAMEEGEIREVLTLIEERDGGFEFRVMSHLPGGDGESETWQEHARGKIGVAEVPREDGGKRRDLSALQQACSRRVISANGGGGNGRGSFLVTGPRWQALKKIWVGEGESLAVLDLEERFADDLAIYALHPSVLDVAVGSIQFLTQGNYLPLAYERLVVWQPLPLRGFSHLRLRSPVEGERETLTCDATLLDQEGNERVTVEGFSMRRVAEDLGAVPKASTGVPERSGEARAVEVPKRLADAGGIQPAEGAEAFWRILQHTTVPQIVVSTRDLQEVFRQADALNRDRIVQELTKLAPPPATGPRPLASGSYVAPGDDDEGRIAAVWQRVLGIDRVGVNDNFFELGGTSLAGIQLVTELKRELQVEVPTVSIFEAPTVRAMARYLRSQAAGPATFEGARSRAERKKQVLDQRRREMVARR